MNSPVPARTVIEARFNGPDGSANGGYACGLAADFIPGAARVRLRSKPPLDVPLDVVTAEKHVELRHGKAIVVEAHPSSLDVADVPAAPSLAEAEAAQERYTGFSAHTFPRCFVCGPEREAGDGLRLFPGAVEGRDIVACVWKPERSLTDGRAVRPRFVWAALDCPSFFGLHVPFDRSYLLGEMTAERLEPIPAEGSLVVYGWGVRIEGRKYFAGAAVANSDGQILAHARHLWIQARDG